MMRRVPQKAVLRTEYPFCTGNACFLHRMPLKMRRVPQEPVLSTECVFRTIGCPLRYRMPQTAERRRALPAASTTNTRNEKALPAANATTARKEVFPLTQRGVRCKKRSPPHRGKTKRERHQKSFSFQFGVRCGARTHDTQNHNLVLYQLN